MFSRTLSAGVLTLAAAARLFAAEPVFPGKDWAVPPAGAEVIPPEKVDEAMAYLQTVVGKEGNSGTMIIQNGYVLWAGDNVDHKGAIWSCTKSFLSTCLGLLMDDGKCSPDDLASKYLPELAADYPEVTLKQLATFTSGLRLERLSLDPGPPNYPPGAALNYSSESDLLAYILTKIAGESLSDLFKRRIADPIGMDPEGWEWKSVHERDGVKINGGAGYPDNGMHITARNLARFGWLYANDGNWDGKQLISQKYIREATVPLVPVDLPMHDPKAWYKPLLGTYGLNWWTNGIGVEGHRIWPSLPASTFAAQGLKNNICIIVPEWKLVLVRTAQDEVINVGLFDGAFKIFKNELNPPATAQK